MHQATSTIFVASPAEQRLRTFAKPLRKLLVKQLQALRLSPRPLGVKKIDGLDHLYRIREGSYRIVYAIRGKDLIVLAVKSSVRREVSRA
ncbi:MAG TPA: type II toxin-antitoxin system RelE/ParE family toxin [Nitrospiraceae bacterium]|nr:type II toxin-antitoxin system RelE/ParE family toxin [Nitrospiraceae bacterium]